MTATLKKAKPFLVLFLDRSTSLNQKHALLLTASAFQAKAVAEILHNISGGLLPVPKQTKLLLRKYKFLLKGISKGTLKSKIKTLRSKYKRVCDLLISVRKLVLDLLQ